jgi:hypothetical protein
MTVVCQEELKTFLATIFDIDEKYVLPKQWNWYNPQSVLAIGEKPLTWVAYKIKSNDPITPNWEVKESEIVNNVTVWKRYLASYNIARIELQFIGTRAEEYANSIQFFPERQDVIDELQDCEGVIMRSDFKVYPTDYIQEGLNSVLSFNTNFKIEWTKKQLVNQEIAQGIETIGGSINEFGL